jgi:hypothetical protein
MLYESAYLLSSPEVPNLDYLVCASSCEPFAALRGSSNGSYAGDVSREDEDWFQRHRELLWRFFAGLNAAFESIEQFLIGSYNNFEGRRSS